MTFINLLFQHKETIRGSLLKALTYNVYSALKKDEYDREYLNYPQEGAEQLNLNVKYHTERILMKNFILFCYIRKGDTK